MMDDVELEGYSHEPSEFLHPAPNFLHDSVNAAAGGGDDGGKAEMRGVVGSSGEGFEEGGPLSAIGVTEVENVEFGFGFKGFKDSAIGGDVAESGPGAEFLKLQDGFTGGVERAGFVRSRGKRTVSAEAGIGDASEKGLEEIRG